MCCRRRGGRALGGTASLPAAPRWPVLLLGLGAPARLRWPPRSAPPVDFGAGQPHQLDPARQLHPFLKTEVPYLGGAHRWGLGGAPQLRRHVVALPTLPVLRGRRSVARGVTRAVHRRWRFCGERGTAGGTRRGATRTAWRGASGAQRCVAPSGHRCKVSHAVWRQRCGAACPVRGGGPRTQRCRVSGAPRCGTARALCWRPLQREAGAASFPCPSQEAPHQHGWPHTRLRPLVTAAL